MFTIQVGHKIAVVSDLSVSLACGDFDGGLVYRCNRLIGTVEGVTFVADAGCPLFGESAAWWLV